LCLFCCPKATFSRILRTVPEERIIQFLNPLAIKRACCWFEALDNQISFQFGSNVPNTIEDLMKIRGVQTLPCNGIEVWFQLDQDWSKILIVINKFLTIVPVYFDAFLTFMLIVGWDDSIGSRIATNMIWKLSGQSYKPVARILLGSG